MKHSREEGTAGAKVLRQEWVRFFKGQHGAAVSGVEEVMEWRRRCGQRLVRG